ncbi:hypothetical protein BKD26_18740 [Streptomyces sp. CB03238]|nr:hypothetical protein BKD26_18740 [Streptomyces sp. CB03238]
MKYRVMAEFAEDMVEAAVPAAAPQAARLPAVNAGGHFRPEGARPESGYRRGNSAAAAIPARVTRARRG